MSLPTIATFVHYGNGTRQEVGVTRVSTQVRGTAGAWSWHACFVLTQDIFGSLGAEGIPSERFYREMSAPRYRTKAEAITGLRTLLGDHFGCVPEGAVLRINRGDERPFPAPVARKAA